jgi:hypothetical protein
MLQIYSTLNGILRSQNYPSPFAFKINNCSQEQESRVLLHQNILEISIPLTLETLNMSSDITWDSHLVIESTVIPSLLTVSVWSDMIKIEKMTIVEWKWEGNLLPEEVAERFIIDSLMTIATGLVGLLLQFLTELVFENLFERILDFLRLKSIFERLSLWVIVRRISGIDR